MEDDEGGREEGRVVLLKRLCSDSCRRKEDGREKAENNKYGGRLCLCLPSFGILFPF